MTIKPGWRGRFFEDFEVGDVYEHPLGRTVTQTDNAWFTLLTQNTAPVHFDHQYASQTEFGRPLVKDKTTPPDEACIDFYLRPYDRNSGIEEAMNAYLSWEIDLVHEIERDGTVVFGVPGETHEAA